MAADGSDVRRLTNDRADDVDPAWSPNGERIVFASNREGTLRPLHDEDRRQRRSEDHEGCRRRPPPLVVSRRVARRVRPRRRHLLHRRAGESSRPADLRPQRRQGAGLGAERRLDRLLEQPRRRLRAVDHALDGSPAEAADRRARAAPPRRTGSDAFRSTSRSSCRSWRPAPAGASAPRRERRRTTRGSAVRHPTSCAASEATTTSRAATATTCSWAEPDATRSPAAGARTRSMRRTASATSSSAAPGAIAHGSTRRTS